MSDSVPVDCDPNLAKMSRMCFLSGNRRDWMNELHNPLVFKANSEYFTGSGPG